jgi:hypothetical protein
MHRLPAAEEAKVLFEEAKNWSVWRWLTEKKRARSTADVANAALDELDKKVKEGWCDALARAYRELEAAEAFESDPKSKREFERAREAASDVPPAIKASARRIREADNEAYNARMDAEDIFDEADRRLSATLARQAAQRAIESWELHEVAIRKAEAAGKAAR